MGRVKRFATDNVTPYQQVVEIEAAHLGSMDWWEAQWEQHRRDILNENGLMKVDGELPYKVDEYLGRLISGQLVSMRCWDKHVATKFCEAQTITSDGIHLNFSFDYGYVPEWRSVEQAAETYVRTIQEHSPLD